MAKNKDQVKPAEKAPVSESTKKPLSTRGKQIEGKVVSTKAAKTAVVAWERRRYVKKYERYERRSSKVAAHVPEDISVKEGDMVRIQETRPISKTKHFVVIEVLEENA